MSALVIGAGAVGQVFGRRLQLGGAGDPSGPIFASVSDVVERKVPQCKAEMDHVNGQPDREFRPLRFIGEPIEVQFDKAPILEKKPGCPDRFRWNEQWHDIVATLGEWRDYNRKGRMARNMRPEHLATAERRGSWGVGRFYFRVRTDSDQVFDLYYDRAPKNVDERKGAWFLYREMSG